MLTVGQDVIVNIGRYGKDKPQLVHIVKSVGNVYLGKCGEKYCVINYDFCGKLHSMELTSLEKAEEEAENNKNMMC